VHWLAHDRGVHALARRLAGRSVGVVLSSGGARGLAHIGVLEELVAAGLGIDRVGGCSMGAFVGAMFAMGMSPEEIHDRCRQEFVVRHPLGDYGIPTHSLLRGERARSMLRRTFSDANIEELPREFFCVSCDLVSGARIVHRSGLLRDAVGASMCLPGVFAPRARDGMLLVDGGVLDSLPVETMAATAEGPVIAVDVGRRFERPVAGRRRRGRPALPPLKETLARSIVLGSIDAAERARSSADVLIEPDTGNCGMLDFSRLDEMVEAGRLAGRPRAAYAMLRQHGAPALH
jgi:predicted acylesterase/phospholipase RssA